MSASVCVGKYRKYRFAIGLFLYQSFDAIDGKQARRTGSSGPLGELFDQLRCFKHYGMNILPVSILKLSTQAFIISSSFPTARRLIGGIRSESPSILVVAFDRCNSGPVEGLLIIIGVFIISGFYGPSWWDQPMTILHPYLPNMPLNVGLVYFGTTFVFYNIVSSGINVLSARRSRQENLYTPFLGLIPYTIFTAAIYGWLFTSPSIVTTHLVPFIIMVGMLFGYHVGLMILGHVCKRPFPYTNIVITSLFAVGWGSSGAAKYLVTMPAGSPLPEWAQYLLAAAQLQFDGKADMAKLASHLEGRVVVTLCFLSIAWYLFFALSVIHELCGILDIWCLAIKPKANQHKEQEGTAQKALSTGAAVAKTDTEQPKDQQQERERVQRRRSRKGR
ncbi:hypothetical protein HK102_001486 [Quaeritorhiza haematococci]|nr:hypothetical protein HK102_001486 [Quaeritorhiza haematococci]